MSASPEEISFWQKTAMYVWGILVTLGSTLIGVIWKKHNDEIDSIKKGIKEVGENVVREIRRVDERVDTVERNYVTTVTYEQNRKEVREGQIDTFRRLDTIAQALARIEGKLDR